MVNEGGRSNSDANREGHILPWRRRGSYRHIASSRDPLRFRHAERQRKSQNLMSRVRKAVLMTVRILGIAIRIASLASRQVPDRFSVLLRRPI